MKKHLFTLLLLASSPFVLRGAQSVDHLEPCVIPKAQQELLDGLGQRSLEKVQHALGAGATAEKSPAVMTVLKLADSPIVGRRFGPVTYAAFHKLNAIARALVPTASTYDLLEALYITGLQGNVDLMEFLRGYTLGRGIDPLLVSHTLTPPPFPEEFAMKREASTFSVWKLVSTPPPYSTVQPCTRGNLDS